LACLLYIANFCKHACSSLTFPCALLQKHIVS
jgi:hypothetical protein